MGKQVTFFLHSDDQLDFDLHLKSFGDVLLIPYFHYENTIATIENTLVEKILKNGNRTYLIQPENFGDIELEPLEKFEYQLVKDQKLPVLHFDKSLNNDKSIFRGRLYFQPKFMEDGEWKSKPDDFVKWADKIISSTRRKLKKYRHHVGKYEYVDYFEEHALDWYLKNEGTMINGGQEIIIK